ncbi:MAG: DUF268 domain-containing protein [Humidesulfovibrio sp.]|nr:DUF268 domain-containing protein [Humidesulfovibrio sp.]
MNVSAPPRTMPQELAARYTMNGLADVYDWYINECYAADEPRVYALDTFAELLGKAGRRELNYYGLTDLWLYQALAMFPVAGQRVAVFGSATPWYESICLAHGAKEVVIFEYGPIVSEHPRVRMMTYEEYERNPEPFDAGLSISSFEHDGLGRYGDPLDPEGDLKAMQAVRKVIRPGGLLYLAVPLGKDAVTWNAHRVYGLARLSMLLAGYETLASFGFDLRQLFVSGRSGVQPVFVLENGEPT